MNVIGLDISKDTIDVTLITAKGEMDYIKIGNSHEGFEKLYPDQKLRKLEHFQVKKVYKWMLSDLK